MSIGARRFVALLAERAAAERLLERVCDELRHAARQLSDADRAEVARLTTPQDAATVVTTMWTPETKGTRNE